MDDPFTVPVEVRFRDIDSMGHVNNAVYATYLEQARSHYYSDIIGIRLDRVRTVLARMEIEYRRPIDLGEETTVALWTSELGESSIDMAYELRAGGEIAAVAETVQVVVDEGGTEARPIPDEWRDRIERHRAGG